jgi:hypothetical protein
MKYLIVSIVVLLYGFSVQAQNNPENPKEAEASLANIQWINNLYEHGVRTEQDTLFISKEVRQILNKEDLMNFMFPEVYRWESALYLMEKMQLKKAFWFLINLYPDYKENVMKTVLSYDHLFEMDKVLISTFYTYSMIDPLVCQMENGKPNIIRPDIAEQKLLILQEMISQINHNRALVANK